jgi:DNA-binding beta-propeller fold protein YncE
VLANQITQSEPASKLKKEIPAKGLKMEILTKFNWSRTAFSAIFFGAAILGISDPSSAQTINPVQQQIPLPGSPFAAITTLDGRHVFVSMGGATSGVAIIRQRKTFATAVQMIPTCGPAFGLAMSNSGRYLLVAVQAGSSCPSGGVQFIDVRKAIAGDPGAAMGTVPTDPTAIEVALSVDNKLVFVANEFSAGQSMCDNPDSVSVIDFRKALSSGQSASSVIGTIPVDCAPVGLAVSGNGRYLYVTNETALPTRSFYDAKACNIPDKPHECPVKTHKGPAGTLTVVDVHEARRNPAGSVVANIPAGCSPTRVMLTNNDKVAWVSAREDNSLLAFNARDILANPNNALLSSAPVGIAPDGAQLFFHKRLMAVANTNRNDSCPGAGGTVSILNLAPLKTGGGAATVGTFDAGVFPRQWAKSPDGSLLYLTEFGSDTLAIFPVNSIVHEVQ